MIKSTNNEFIKLVKALKTNKGRDNARLFLLEGKKFVDEAVSAIDVQQIIVTEKVLPVLRCINRLPDEKVVLVSENVMEVLSSTKTPQGVIAVCPFIDSKYETVLSANASRLYVALDKVSDPGNVGTLIRSSHAFGASGVFLSNECADIYNSKTVRASAGSIINLPLAKDVNLNELIVSCKRMNLKVLALSQLSKKPIDEADLSTPILIIIGAETGLDPELLKIADDSAFIPMPGGSESLNLSVAGSIALYEARKD